MHTGESLSLGYCCPVETSHSSVVVKIHTENQNNSSLCAHSCLHTEFKGHLLSLPKNGRI